MTRTFDAAESAVSMPAGESLPLRVGWTRRHRRIAALLGRRPAEFSLCILIAYLVIALAPGTFTQWDPLAIDTQIRLLPPSRLHPFGTDELGRDVLARVLHGARLSLGASGLAVLAAALVGSGLGAVGGYLGGKVDEVIMRVTDMLIAFPYMFVAIAVATALGPSLRNAALSLALIWWTVYARLMRAQVMQVASEQFVEAARSIGARDLRILVRHVIPNSFSPVLVQATLDVGVAVVALGALSFVGAGAKPPSPEWGAMVAGGRLVLFEAWWISTFPGLAIFAFTMAANLLGDALRDALDPRLLT